MTKQEILDLPIGKHLATDILRKVYSIEVGEQGEFVFIQFGDQRIYIINERFSLLVGNMELTGVVNDYTFERLTLLK